MLTVARDEERTSKLEQPRGGPRKRFIEEVDLKSEDEAIETSSMALDIDLKQSVSRRTRSRRKSRKT